MDFTMLIWIAFTNAITNAMTGLVIGVMMYWYGRKQGERSKELLKAEIQSYIKNDLFPDLKEVISGQVKGVFGPFAKSTVGEVPEVAREWANNNPGIMQMLLGVGKAAAVNKLAKTLGVPKEVKDYLKMVSQGMVIQPDQSQIQLGMGMGRAGELKLPPDYKRT